jgi:plasmid stability protein
MQEAAMATLTLKNAREELVAQLKEEAKQNHRSLNQEALARLEASVALRKRSADETIAALRRLHQRLSYMKPLSASFIDRAKKQGRL